MKPNQNTKRVIERAVSEQRWGTFLGSVSPQIMFPIALMRLNVSESVVKLGGLIDPEVRT